MYTHINHLRFGGNAHTQLTFEGNVLYNAYTQLQFEGNVLFDAKIKI